MASLRKRTLAAMLVLLLVTSSGVSPIGNAVAADTSCSTLDAMWYDMVNIGNWQLLDGGCNEDVQQVEAQENLEQKVDLNQMGRDAYEGRQPLFVKTKNELEYSGTVASVKARAKMVEMMNNGTTNATKIRNEVHKVINRYYAVREKNVMETYNAHFAQLSYQINATKNDSDISNEFVYTEQTLTDTDGYTFDFQGWAFENSSNVSAPTWNYTLVNGTNVTYNGVYAKYQYNTDPANYLAWGMFHQPNVDGAGGDDNLVPLAWVSGVSDSSLDQNLSAGKTINVTQYESALNQIDSKAQQMRSNYDLTYIDSVVTNYEAGAVNTSDMLTPEVLVQEFGADSNETGYLAYQYAMASYLGISASDFNGTASVTISAENATVIDGDPFVVNNNTTLSKSNYSASGLLFADPPSDGSFQVGTTYHAGNLSGPVWFINGSSARKVELSGNFTVTNATGRDGDTLQQVNMTEYNQQTYNASEFVNQTKQTTLVRKVIEKHYTTAGAGSTGSSSGISKEVIGLVVVLLAAAAFVGRGDS